jgi:phosphomannomutase
LTAATFESRGWTVYLYRTIVPTPLVAFGVLYKKAAVGVMVTASHNPKADNGYKVYWDNGIDNCNSYIAHVNTWINRKYVL